MAIDTAWAISELDTFLSLTTLSRPRDRPGVINMTSYMYPAAAESDILAAVVSVEAILGRVIPDWKTTVPSENNKSVNRWCQHREAAERAKAILARKAEIDEKLGDNAPRLSAGHLHPWVWDSAKTLWTSGHYRQAVAAAAVGINAQTQAKVSRKDVSEVDLFKQCFSLDAPAAGRPRLRLWLDDGSKTYQSVQKGAMAYADGLYSAIRNPASHATLPDLTEDEGLEQLAAFSVLARWVDNATILT